MGQNEKNWWSENHYSESLRFRPIFFCSTGQIISFHFILTAIMEQSFFENSKVFQTFLHKSCHGNYRMAFFFGGGEHFGVRANFETLSWTQKSDQSKTVSAQRCQVSFWRPILLPQSFLNKGQIIVKKEVRHDGLVWLKICLALTHSQSAFFHPDI